MSSTIGIAKTLEYLELVDGAHSKMNKFAYSGAEIEKMVLEALDWFGAQYVTMITLNVFVELTPGKTGKNKWEKLEFWYKMGDSHYGVVPAYKTQWSKTGEGKGHHVLMEMWLRGMFVSWFDLGLLKKELYPEFQMEVSVHNEMLKIRQGTHSTKQTIARWRLS